MIVVYESITGKVKKFVAKASALAPDITFHRVTPGLVINEPFVVLTSTIGQGQVPPNIVHFLKTNFLYLVGVAASGNRNFKNDFARSADVISSMYGVPTLLKFELDGQISDVQIFIEKVNGMKTTTQYSGGSVNELVVLER